MPTPLQDRIKTVLIANGIICAVILLLSLIEPAGTTYSGGHELLSPPETARPVIFVGDSHVRSNEWAQFFHRSHIVNRGVSGETTGGLSRRIGRIARQYPSKVFIIIGTNDVFASVDHDRSIDNYRKILDHMREISPSTRIYACAVFPSARQSKTNQKIVRLNAGIRKIVEERGYVFLDTFTPLVKRGAINPQFTSDGVHLNRQGYNAIGTVLLPYVLNRAA